jgi:hypothetical protein
MDSNGNIIIIIMEAKMKEMDEAMKLIIADLQPQDQTAYLTVSIFNLRYRDQQSVQERRRRENLRSVRSLHHFIMNLRLSKTGTASDKLTISEIRLKSNHFNQLRKTSSVKILTTRISFV